MTSSIQSRLGTAPEEGCKAPVKTVANNPITLSGEQTINTVAVVAGDRVLVNGQVDKTENGIYNVQTTAWTYAKDWNKSNDVIAGMLVPSSETVELYQLKPYTGTFTAGTTSIEFQTGVVASPQREAQLGSAATAKVFTLTTMTYTVGVKDLEVERNGQVLILNNDYTETSSSTVTLLTDVNSTDDFVFKANTAVTPTSTITSAVTHTVGGTIYNLSDYLIARNTIALFTDGDATPAVTVYELYKTANTSPTTITNFDTVSLTKKIWVMFGDSYTTIDFTASSLLGNAGVDWTPSQGDHMTCVWDGASWYCDISDNTA